MIDTATLKDNTDLIALVKQSVTLKRITSGLDPEYAGKCPLCGGKDRFHVHGKLWMCRQCHPKWGDAIEYVQWSRGLTFQQAAESLGAKETESVPIIKREPPPPEPIPAPTWDAAAAHTKWQTYVMKMEGSAGEAYLIERGLCPETWRQYGIGYDALRNAIAMPWFRGSTLYAINYRLLDVPKERRFQVEKNGTRMGILFGGQALLPGFTQLLPNGKDPLASRNLILVEGELNCASIYQAAYPLVDVLSMGSESAKLPDSFIAIAARYRACIVWQDRRTLATKTATQIPGAVATWSESGHGEHDANDLLQAGKLRTHIGEILAAATPSRHQEALQYDLQDAGLL